MPCCALDIVRGGPALAATYKSGAFGGIVPVADLATMRIVEGKICGSRWLSSQSNRIGEREAPLLPFCCGMRKLSNPPAACDFAPHALSAPFRAQMSLTPHPVRRRWHSTYAPPPSRACVRLLFTIRLNARIPRSAVALELDSYGRLLRRCTSCFSFAHLSRSQRPEQS